MGQPIIREGPRQVVTKTITQVKIPLQTGTVAPVMVRTLALVKPMPLVGVVEVRMAEETTITMKKRTTQKRTSRVRKTKKQKRMTKKRPTRSLMGWTLPH